MAATIAKAIGIDKTRVKETHRLGHQAARAEANTWRTFATVFIRADGSGTATVTRDGKILLAFDFSPEDVTPSAC